jgi:hypothetical protein
MIFPGFPTIGRAGYQVSDGKNQPVGRSKSAQCHPFNPMVRFFDQNQVGTGPGRQDVLAQIDQIDPTPQPFGD